MLKKRIFFDMDGVLAKFRDDADYSEIFKKGYFAELPPQQSVINALLKFVDEDTYEVCIATCYPTTVAKQEKGKWLEKHLGDAVSDVTVVYIPDGQNKARHIAMATGRAVGSEDYLVDDFTKNLVSFCKSGGKGIKLINGINDTHRTWKGARVDMSDDCYTKIAVIMESRG